METREGGGEGWEVRKWSLSFDRTSILQEARVMATDPRDVAETIARQREQMDAAKEALREVFGSEAGWRRLASGSFSGQIWEGVRAVVAPAPAVGSSVTYGWGRES